jgi:hypothetical protein
MFEFILEFIGEFLLEALCHLGDSCIQELLRWTRDVL